MSLLGLVLGKVGFSVPYRDGWFVDSPLEQSGIGSD